MEFEFAAIKRNEKYSPNHVTNDTLILNKTGEELRKQGCGFKIYDEYELNGDFVEEEYIFSMARGEESIEKLQKMNEAGKFIINPPASILNCYRVNLSVILPDAGIDFPPSIIVDTAADDSYRLKDITEKNKLWIKRGDVHAIHKEDVSLVYYDEEINYLLKEFNHRGIKKALLQEHLYGDVVKFYGVKNSGFFYWYYLNGDDKFSFDIDELKFVSDKSAEVLKLVVYGGDAVISEGGKITIIDFNDWPSFAPIRDEASNFIAEAIYSGAVAHHKNKSRLTEIHQSNSNTNTN